jgi:hypothetical protein
MLMGLTSNTHFEHFLTQTYTQPHLSDIYLGGSKPGMVEIVQDYIALTMVGHASA